MGFTQRRSQHQFYDISKWYVAKGGTNVGIHACIGRRFAETEMKVVLAVLVGSFEFGKVDGWNVEKYSLITVRPKNGMYLHVRKV
jgi:cytochrome P450